MTLPPRAAKAHLAMFHHARKHGTWRPCPVDPSRPELTEGQQLTLTAHWTVAGLGHAMGVNRDTAGKALHELVEGGWVRREDPRNKGQFGGIDYCLTVPASVTRRGQSEDRGRSATTRSGIQELRVANRRPESLKTLRSGEFGRMWKWKLRPNRQTWPGMKQKAIELASKSVLRQGMTEEE